MELNLKKVNDFTYINHSLINVLDVYAKYILELVKFSLEYFA